MTSCSQAREKLVPRGYPVADFEGVPETTKAPLLQGFRVIGETGFEPAAARPPAGCATRLRHSPWFVVQKRATGIEPALRAWKAPVQPQHFARGRTRVPMISARGGNGGTSFGEPMIHADSWRPHRDPA